MFKLKFKSGAAPFIPVAILLNMLIETLGRGSVVSMLAHIMVSPLVFLFNTLLIFTSLTLSLLCSRKIFAISMIVIFWLAIGITNGVLLTFRATPFSAGDLFMLKTALEMIELYFNTFEIILILIAIVATCTGVVLIWRRTKKIKPDYKAAVVHCASSILFTALLFVILTNRGLLSSSFSDMRNAYKEYGFNFCFACSAFEKGIDEPDNYSDSEVEELKNELLDQHEETLDTYARVTPTPTPPIEEMQEVLPNIIYVQLESFFDVNYLDDISFSENPVPYFESLKKHYASGFLTVPTLGAGTANTEFEILTGMNRAYFGPGEYPYKTILQSMTCESAAYNLREYGYSCHAIHDNSGTFYDRNIIFSQLGFDTFTSIEYMQNVEYNALGWAEDAVLVPEIIDTLDSTEDRDFVFTISVQAHGKYPNEYIEESTIKVENVEKQMISAYEYYADQLKEMDNFIKELVESLEDYPEPVVLVLYGDHLPSLEIEETDLSDGSLYQTEYVIWTNYASQYDDEDLCAYQLSAHVMELLGLDSGYITKFHQHYNGDEEDYDEMLSTLEYDCLYGDLLLYEGINPYEATDIKMGIKDIEITGLQLVDNSNTEETSSILFWEPEPTDLYVYGSNFTCWSIVYINGHECDTEFIDSSTLVVRETGMDVEDEVFVAQQGEDGVILSYTESVTW